MKGRGFGSYVKGAPVTRVSDMLTGDLLLMYTPGRQAENTIRVTTEKDERVYVCFVNPEDWTERWGQEFCIWNSEVERGTDLFWRAVPKPKEIARNGS